MKNMLNFEQLLEFKSGHRYKNIWTDNDNTIALYYEKFGFDKIGITKENFDLFINEYIGSTVLSFKAHASSLRYILTDGKKVLSHISKSKGDVVNKYNDLSEPELRKIIINIITKITKYKRKKNFILSQEKSKGEELEQKVTKNKEEDLKNKYQRNFKKVKKNKLKIPYDEGDIVNHKFFGEGEVISVNGNKMEVLFHDIFGKKNILYLPEFFV